VQPAVRTLKLADEGAEKLGVSVDKGSRSNQHCEHGTGVLIRTRWRRIAGSALAASGALMLLFGASPASATGTLTQSWSPSSPTASTPVTVTGSISGCGAGNGSAPSLYDLISGPNGYSNNNYLGSTTTLSNGGDTASATVSLGTLAAGSYTVQFYGRGTPCFASSFNFTWSTATTMVVSAAATAPGVPSSVSAAAHSDGSVALSWVAPASNGATISAYTVTPTPACPGCSGLSVTGNPASASTNITGLATGTSYTFTVTATNSAGTSSPSSASNAVVPATAPNAPPAPTATADSDGSVALSWPAPAGNGATVTAYTITPTPACSGCGGLAVTGNPAAASTSITGLATGTSYTFTVTATNSVGTSSASPASNAVVAAVATSTLLSVAPAAPITGQQVTFTASVTPAPGGGTVGFTDAGTPIPGCTAQPVSTGGLAVCTTSYQAGGDYTIDAAFSGSGSGAYLSSSTVSAASVIVVDPARTSVQPTSVSPVLQPPAAGARAWLSSMALVTDPYLINEHDLATLVSCVGASPCQVSVAASVRLGRRGQIVRLPSGSVTVAGGASTIVRLRDHAAVRARIRGYLARHPHQHLTIKLTLTLATGTSTIQTHTYTIALRTLPGLR